MKMKGWIRPSPEAVLAVIVAAVIAPVPICWTVNLNHLLDTPSVRVIHISSPSSPYAENTYSDVDISVDNQGSATAEGCLVRAGVSPPSSEDPEDVVMLAESELFDLSPRDGRVVTMSLYLPDTNGKKVIFGTGCGNPDSASLPEAKSPGLLSEWR